MADTEQISLSERVSLAIADGVAEVRLDRPDKLNALDAKMFEALIEAGERVSGDASVRAVVLHGAGRCFCAGLDMQTFASVAAGRRDGALADLVVRTHGAANAPQRAALVWRDVPVPVIAALHGVAIGGGFQIALGADIRYVAPDARLSILEIKWGLVPDMGGVALMRELARGDVIRELAFTGRQFTGAEAVAYGFATAAHAEPLAAARLTAREIAAKSPDAVRALKRLLNMSGDADLPSILVAESKEQAALIGSPNQIEAIRAGVENRPARFADPA
jgi:enoyl-CoA hydratase/carnithine racemase